MHVEHCDLFITLCDGGGEGKEFLEGKPIVAEVEGSFQFSHAKKRSFDSFSLVGLH